jgi:hypothetical protein
MKASGTAAGVPAARRPARRPTNLEQAWQRAAQVGINQTRKELGVSDRALRTAWQRRGLGLLPRPTATPTTAVLDPAFVASTAVCCRPGNAGRRSWPPGCAAMRSTPPGRRGRVELNSERRTRRPTTRAWAHHPPCPTGPAPLQQPPAPRRAPPRRPGQPHRPNLPITRPSQKREVLADAR